jgi:APA family basic amino acid/polyamine antiporter
VALIVGQYSVHLFPEARTEQVVALSVVALFTIIQWIGIRGGAAVQNVTSLVKGVALLLFIVACFWLGTRPPHAGTAVTVDHEVSMFVAFILALQGVIYTYDGWSAVIYFSEEVKDYGKAIPRAMLMSVATIAVLYVAINLAMLAVVSLPTIAGSDLAAAVVVERLFGTSGANIVRGLIVLVLLSAVSSNVLMAPRVLYAMATDGLFWRGAREVNRGGTPDIALLISSMVAAAFIVTGTFNTVIAKLAFFFVANYTLSFITLFALRLRDPDAPRPYRSWGHPVTTGIAVLASLAFLIGAAASDPKNTIWAFGILVLSVPLYLMIRKKA